MSIITATENGDIAYNIESHCLKFFTQIVRNAPVADYLKSFSDAWAEDKDKAVRILMNMRDARTGKGEKLIPIVLLLHIKSNVEPSVYEQILRVMLKYGCWKDLLRINELESRISKLAESTSIELRLFAEQLEIDLKMLDEPTDETVHQPISLCAKWAPSERSHFNHHPMFAANQIMKMMGVTPSMYRKLCSRLRTHLNILEKLMATQRFDLIDFSKVPAIAMTKMKSAFNRDSNSEGTESESRRQLHLSYKEFIAKLVEGKTKVNVKGIQPHELVHSYMVGEDVDPLIEEQWNQIKANVVKTNSLRDVTAIVDVSGSMVGQPMEVAIALGILVAECTSGPFHGKVITFNTTPSWHVLTGSNLKEQVQCMEGAPWGGSTNLRATFDMILTQALNAKLTRDEMVRTLFIFTDMQFDSCSTGWETTFDYAKRSFTEAGYELPRIVCWNLRTSSNKVMPVTEGQNGVAMISGFSSELLKCILNAQAFDPMSILLHILEPYTSPPILSECKTNKLTYTTEFVNKLQTAISKSCIKKGPKAKSKKSDLMSDSIFSQLSDETDSETESDQSSESESSTDSDSVASENSPTGPSFTESIKNIFRWN